MGCNSKTQILYSKPPFFLSFFYCISIYNVFQKYMVLFFGSHTWNLYNWQYRVQSLETWVTLVISTHIYNRNVTWEWTRQWALFFAHFLELMRILADMSTASVHRKRSVKSLCSCEHSYYSSIFIAMQTLMFWGFFSECEHIPIHIYCVVTDIHVSIPLPISCVKKELWVYQHFILLPADLNKFNYTICKIITLKSKSVRK